MQNLSFTNSKSFNRLIISNFVVRLTAITMCIRSITRATILCETLINSIVITLFFYRFASNTGVVYDYHSVFQFSFFFIAVEMLEYHLETRRKGNFSALCVCRAVSVGKDVPVIDALSLALSLALPLEVDHLKHQLNQLNHENLADKQTITKLQACQKSIEKLESHCSYQEYYNRRSNF